MISLTLRSGRDGRFLARIVDRGGFAFVLDFGDQRIIDDVSQRLLKGFTMWRMGALITAVPQQAEMLQLLAEFYAHEGLLVSFEEPNWPRASGHVPLELGDDPPTELMPLPVEDFSVEEADAPTELAPLPSGFLLDIAEMSSDDETTENMDIRGMDAGDEGE